MLNGETPSPAVLGTVSRFDLVPAFLLAATIDHEGCIVLPDADATEPDAHIAFLLDGEGQVWQRRCATGDEPLDLPLFSRCLARQFGALTPGVFRNGQTGPEANRDADAQRLKLLYDAFSIHLLAYEERLI